jgi:hypothetical protein
MKPKTIVVFLFAILGIAALGHAAAQNDSNLIVPGQRIGQTRLGRFGAVYLAKLPKPDANDAEMQKYHSVWLTKRRGGRNDTLYIFSVANGPRDIQPPNGVTIRLIRVTSPWYHTASRISTGNTLPQILPSFPGAHPTDQTHTLYDDAKHGIAFEFAGRATTISPCIAIMVHPPNDVNLTTMKDVNEILRENGIQP